MTSTAAPTTAPTAAPTAAAFDQRTARALVDLAAWSSELRWDAVPEHVRDRFALVLFDTLVVSRAGAALDESRRMRAAWRGPEGAASVMGAPSSSADRAAWLNGAAAVALELDEASRVTRGHAASQTVFAVLAEAQERGASPADTCAALLVGHEVASRIGRSVTMGRGLHPHGSWAGIGAAAGVARLTGLGGAGSAVAMDVAGGLMLAAPFACAPAGSPVRDHWAGFCNFAGLMAARIAAVSDTETVRGTVHAAFSLALGEMRPEEIDLDLGTSYAVMDDFIKRHAACGYSHAVLDVLMELLESGDVPQAPEDIAAVLVRGTTSVAELDTIQVDTRLGALFSLPYLVAAVLTQRESGPAITEAGLRSRPDVLALARRVRIEVDPDLQALMPQDRGAAVELVTRDGRTLRGQVPNARWDPRYFPATWADVRGKAAALLGPLGIDETALHAWVLGMADGSGSVVELDHILNATPLENS